MTHPLYNRTNFPVFVQNNGAWDIYRNEAGKCAAIPVYSDSGHQASHFGDMKHVERVNRQREETAKTVAEQMFPRYLSDAWHETVKRLIERHGVSRVRAVAQDAMTRLYKRTEESFEAAFSVMEHNLKMGKA